MNYHARLGLCNTVLDKISSLSAISLVLLLLLTTQVSAMEPGKWILVDDEDATFPGKPVPETHYITPVGDEPGWKKNRIGFLVKCDSVKFDQVDPIVSPGRHSHHMHEFFGNPNVTKDTTTQSLINTPHSKIKCTDVNDKSSYWSPAVYQNGKRAKAIDFKAYYKSQTPDTVPFPLGLRMVTGKAMSKQNQKKRIGWWQTGDGDSIKTVETTIDKNKMISRAKGHNITLRINYPNCWDGIHLDSPDHFSHMAYAKNHKCPASHPLKVPQLTTITTYDVEGGPNFKLASGAWFTFHQDFYNGWDPDHLDLLNTKCIISQENCRTASSKRLRALGQRKVEVIASRTQELPGTSPKPPAEKPKKKPGNNSITFPKANITMLKGKKVLLVPKAKIGGKRLDPTEGYFKNPKITWSQVSGPGKLTFSYPRKLHTYVNTFKKGKYVAKISIEYNGKKIEKRVKITVK